MDIQNIINIIAIVLSPIIAVIITRYLSIRTDKKKDKMENGRFEILNNGLAYIYNEAPIISGGDDIINYYKGSILTLPSSIKVDDDYDTISRNQIIIDDDNVTDEDLMQIIKGPDFPTGAT